MNVYFATRENGNMKEIMDRINFETVLVGRGHFSEKTCIWMAWQNKNDDSNERLFDLMDVNFGLRDMGVCLNQGTLFPENLIWDNQYEDVFVFGTAKELETYIARFRVFTQEGNYIEPEFGDAFIYKMEIEVKETDNGAGAKRKELKVLDRGFIYEG